MKTVRCIFLLVAVCAFAGLASCRGGAKTAGFEPTGTELEALAAARAQLAAYNDRDIDAFAACYSEDVKVYSFPGKLTYQGRDILHERYGRMFEKATALHCTILSETVKGNKVIHEESVVRYDPDEEPVHAVAIYIVEGGLITEVHFL